MRPRSLLLLLSLLAVPLLGCGGERPDPDPEEEAASEAQPSEGERAAGAVVANGEPMPSAERTGGIPPYPDAVVWNRFPRENPRFHSLEAFTSDDWREVVSFYDRELPGWERAQAEDAVIYEKGEDEAALTVMTWNGADAPPDSPEVLREARTAIGLAWRREP